MPVCSGQCAFTKRPADAAIGQSPCDTSSPSDTPQAFHTNPFSSLPRPLPGIPSVVPRVLRFSGRWGQMKAYLTKSLPLLHQIYRIRPLHNLSQGTLLRLVFSTPPIDQRTFLLSRIRGWRLMMTCNQPLIMFLQSKLLLLTQCLRDIHGVWMESIDLLR